MASKGTEGRDLDVVVFGATGFVGRLVAQHLADHAPEAARIGLAGRSEGRLQQVRADLGDRACDWPLLVADVADPKSVDDLARSASVVATTVGPYLRYGMPLVAACAEAGTHYADLTGEPTFVRATLDRYAALAASTGARIVHSCGFDSVPSDLAVLLLAVQARADGTGELGPVTLTVTSLRGGVSGGTVDSMRAETEEVTADPSLRRLYGDPYALSPDRTAEPDLGRQDDMVGVHRDHELNVWVGPFVMAPHNARIVRLSNALQGWSYGRGLQYREQVSFGHGRLAPLTAMAATAALGGLAAGMGFGPTRAVLDRVLPAPGDGPGEATRRNGRFRMDVRATTTGGVRYRCLVAADGDPGYQATSVMFGESALCLALDADRLPQRYGVLTPAAAMGDALVERLRAAGLTFDVERL